MDNGTHRRSTFRKSPNRPSGSGVWTPANNLLTPAKRTGRIAENLAVYYLRARGWVILARNYKTHAGEIDIIASRMNEDLRGYPTVAFVEVKSRTTSKGLPPVMSVTRAKRHKITAAMHKWIGSHARVKAVYRCDIASIVVEKGRAPRITYYPAAFCAREEFVW